MSSDTEMTDTKRIQDLKDELNQIHLSIKSLLLSELAFFHLIILKKQEIQNNADIDLLSYYGLLKTFVPSEQFSLDPRRFYSLHEKSLLKINNYLPTLANLAKLEMYSLRHLPEKANPVIKQITANFVEMHVIIFQELLTKPLNSQQIDYLGGKIASLHPVVEDITKLNILEFISQVETSLSKNLYPQLRSPMFALLGRAKVNKKLTQDYINLFEDLHSKPLTAEALIGAVHLIKEELVSLLHKSLRNIVTYKINQFLMSVQEDPRVKRYEQGICVAQFHAQANKLDFTLPINPLIINYTSLPAAAVSA